VAKGEPRIAELSAWVNAQCARDTLAGDGAAIWAAADRGEITPEQAPLVVRSLLSAGVDTTVHTLSAVLYAFATNPGQWTRLKEQPALARVAFDEAIRWESPVQTFFRTTTTDIRVGFGMGIHQCVGQHVARLEAEAILTAPAKRVRRSGTTTTRSGPGTAFPS